MVFVFFGVCDDFGNLGDHDLSDSSVFAVNLEMLVILDSSYFRILRFLR